MLSTAGDGSYPEDVPRQSEGLRSQESVSARRGQMCILSGVSKCPAGIDTCVFCQESVSARWRYMCILSGVSKCTAEIYVYIVRSQ